MSGTPCPRSQLFYPNPYAHNGRAPAVLATFFFLPFEICRVLLKFFANGKTLLAKVT